MVANVVKVKNNVATPKKNAKNMYVRAVAFNGKKKGKYGNRTSNWERFCS